MKSDTNSASARFVPLALLAATLGLASTASAAELRTGGLHIVRNDVISIASEEVFISAEEIRIVYHLRNDTGTAQDLSMAFPLPALNASFRSLDLDLPNEASPNFVDFAVTSDGVAIEPELIEQATIFGIDRTAELRALDLPLNPLAVPELSEAQRSAASEQGLVAGTVPAWDYQTIASWQQTFPPNSETVIEARYTPVLGGGPWGVAPLQSQRFRSTYCAGDNFAGQLTVEAGKRPYSAHTIGYILAGPNNWEGPIGEFRLVVDKGSEGAFVSFCGENVRRISMTEFEMGARQLYASGDLDIVIFYPDPPVDGVTPPAGAAPAP